MRTLTIPDARATSWNDLYEQTHWSKRKKIKDTAHQLVRAHLNPDDGVFDVKVDIKIEAYYKHHPVDSDNVCAKVYIDGLRGWWIEDDTIEFVRQVTTRSRIGDDDRIVITAIPVYMGTPLLFHCNLCSFRTKRVDEYFQHNEDTHGVQ